MKVFLTHAAARTVRGLPPETKRRLKRAVLALPMDPIGEKGKLDVRRLAGHGDIGPVYRLRVGDWRAVFRILGARIEVVRVFHRSEGYGWMERFGF